ncbi:MULTISPECIES: hypothetical protein [unclassified Amycolatopsis]|uniref:hypothetical protein n=1 Tax=unclassified Amycolatopsis TaxID=2618356 RepID=UPI0033A59472
MTNPGEYGPPKGLGQARIFMWIQVAFSVLGSILIGAVAGASAGGFAGVLLVIVVVNILMAIALAACAIVLPQGKQWAFVTAIVVEAVIIINGIVTLISSGFSGVLPLVFAGLALRGLLQRDVRDWISARNGQAPAV